ncbi:hypothetical protein [Methylobacterium nigriterrae]|uniref:hypothetical protein n=1 Tax=Methylobacterium nigriterrae TaxID=3127512 RepID=UPI0030132E39
MATAITAQQGKQLVELRTEVALVPEHPMESRRGPPRLWTRRSCLAAEQALHSAQPAKIRYRWDSCR